MDKNFDPALTEEQLAAYLDGMLTDEENVVVENVIDNDEQMQGVMNDIDHTDSAYLNYDQNEDIPLEIMSDDFTLPEVGVYGYDDNTSEETGSDYDEYAMTEPDDEYINDETEGYTDSYEDSAPMDYDFDYS